MIERFLNIGNFPSEYIHVYHKDLSLFFDMSYSVVQTANNSKVHEKMKVANVNVLNNNISTAFLW